MNNLMLDSGLIINYENGLEGGGVDQRFDFITVLEQQEKKYKRALEWCSGFGIIGYELLTRNFCEHIAFLDSYDPAIQTCIKIAVDNNIQDNVTTYLLDNIAALPHDELFDLVVANPPHHFNKEEMIGYLKVDAAENGYEMSSQQLADSIRITIDDELTIHREFFKNISKHLVPDADIFISTGPEMELIIRLAKKNKLVLINQYIPLVLLEQLSKYAKILHFKYKP